LSFIGSDRLSELIERYGNYLGRINGLVEKVVEAYQIVMNKIDRDPFDGGPCANYNNLLHLQSH
jgi:hypothetical protein